MTPEPITSWDTDGKFIAAVDLLKRTGSTTFRIAHTDPEDGDPIAWYAVATWRDGRGVRDGRWDAAAGVDPLVAVLRLCEQVIDGGTCQHCGRPTIFNADADVGPLELIGCVYAFDPELSTFRRGCEGDDT